MLATARQLKIWRRKNLSLDQKTILNKWSGIYETSVMPHLLIPIIKESLGISLSAFKVTDKTRKAEKQGADIRSMLPFLILTLLSVFGIVRVLWIMDRPHVVSLLILLFWLIRNLYYLVLSMFLVDGRDDDGESVKVQDFIPVNVDVLYGGTGSAAGITTQLNEHCMTVFLDEGVSPGIGDHVRVKLAYNGHRAELRGVVTGLRQARRSQSRTQTIEILDFGNDRYEYWEILYDRIPTLPQSLQRDFGIIPHLWQNIAHRVARTTK